MADKRWRLDVDGKDGKSVGNGEEMGHDARQVEDGLRYIIIDLWHDRRYGDSGYRGRGQPVLGKT